MQQNLYESVSRIVIDVSASNTSPVTSGSGFPVKMRRSSLVSGDRNSCLSARRRLYELEPGIMWVILFLGTHLSACRRLLCRFSRRSETRPWNVSASRLVNRLWLKSSSNRLLRSAKLRQCSNSLTCIYSFTVGQVTSEICEGTWRDASDSVVIEQQATEPVKSSERLARQIRQRTVG